jgi:ABC-type amino acid transport substrate-binding protein
MLSGNQNSAYRRLIDLGILRCGYTPWPVLLDVDPKSKAPSGVFFDYTNELARVLDIKIEWVEEMSFAQMPDALNEGRIDIHSSGAWTNPIRGKLADNVIPISYEHINAFVRADETRFEDSLPDINSPDVRVSVIDGESSEAIYFASYPRATAIRLAPASAGGQMLSDLVSGKADVAFTDPLTFHRFVEKHPGKIKQVKSKFPVQVYGSPIWVKKGEVELKNTLNVATMQLINDGTIETILSKHEPVKGMFLRPNPSFLSVVGL